MEDLHRYSVWNELRETAGNKAVINCNVLTFGIHGTMEDRNDTEEAVFEQGQAASLPGIMIAHNQQELARARDESAKWEERLRQSPLGNTEQDFVAFYQDVVDLFSEWLRAHELPVKEGD